jgi:hypothetical protein
MVGDHRSGPRQAGQAIRLANSVMPGGRPVGVGCSSGWMAIQRVATRNWLGPHQPRPAFCAMISSVFTMGRSAATTGRGTAWSHRRKDNAPHFARNRHRPVPMARITSAWAAPVR